MKGHIHAIQKRTEGMVGFTQPEDFLSQKDWTKM